MQKHWRGRWGQWLRFVSGPGLAVSLCGCTVLMTEPTSISPDQRATGISYKDAAIHLDEARSKMKEGLKTLDQLSDVTVGGVGVGTGGAAISTLAGVHTDVARTLLTVGGVSYAVNQTSRLQTQTAIYSAGLRRLRCIDQNGYRLYQATDGLRSAIVAQRPAFEAVFNQLATHLKEARQPSQMSNLLKAVVAEGDKALGDAAKVKKPMDNFIAATDVGFEMVSAVDATVESVNAQIRANKADAAEAAIAGKQVTDFIAAHTAPSTVAASGNLPAIAQGVHDPLADTIRADIESLKVQADVVRALLPATPIQASTVGSCLSEIPALGSVVVLPSPTITVYKGGDAFGVNAYTEDGQALAFVYSGPTPTSQQLSVSNQGGSRYSVSAPADAKSDQYTIRFFRANDPKSVPLDPPLLINVAARPLEPKAEGGKSDAKGAAATPKPAVKTDQPKASGGDTAIKPANGVPIPKPPQLRASAASPASAAPK